MHFSQRSRNERSRLIQRYKTSILHYFFNTSTSKKEHLKTFFLLNKLFACRPCQKSKLESFFHYFDLLETQDEEEIVTISRQVGIDVCNFSKKNSYFFFKVMNGKQWLTIEDWMESSVPLCNLIVRHDGRIEDAETQCMNISFCSHRLGGDVLEEGAGKVKHCLRLEINFTFFLGKR